MGRMRFVVPRPELLTEEFLQRVYLCGIDGVPWCSQNRWLPSSAGQPGREFVVQRAVHESGNLFVPWVVEGRETVLSTATLMEREEPYNLPVELARGTLNRLRNQSAELEMAGLTVPEQCQDTLRLAAQALVCALTSAATDEEAADQSQEAIRRAMHSLDWLVDAYVRQVLGSRHQQAAQLPVLFGVRLDLRKLADSEAAALPRACNAVSLGIRWRDLEVTAGMHEWDRLDDQLDWCRSQGLRVIGGPLLELGHRSVPDWLYLWEDDFDEVQSYVLEHARSVVQRYQGKVQIWNCAAPIKVSGGLSLTEEQNLRLIVNAIGEVRRADSSTPLIVTVDQPWAEYLSGEDLDLSPLHFADSLMRADLGVSGVGLEINLGYWPGGTLPRDLLEISSMLDRWSLLGLPLLVFLRIPSSAQLPSGGTDSGPRPLEKFAGGPTPATQRDEAEKLVSLLLAKHYVQGVIWNQLCDAERSRYAAAGLFDAQHQPKPVLKTLASIRQKHLI